MNFDMIFGVLLITSMLVGLYFGTRNGRFPRISKYLLHVNVVTLLFISLLIATTILFTTEIAYTYNIQFAILYLIVNDIVALYLMFNIWHNTGKYLVRIQRPTLRGVFIEAK